MTEETWTVEALKERALHFQKLREKHLAATGNDDTPYRESYEHYRDRWYAAAGMSEHNQGAQ
jgi:hypothetical protein